MKKNLLSKGCFNRKIVWWISWWTNETDFLWCYEPDSLQVWWKTRTTKNWKLVNSTNYFSEKRLIFSKVATSHKLFHFGSNKKEKAPNHGPEHLLFRLIVLRVEVWHLFLVDLSQSEKLFEIKLPFKLKLPVIFE